MSRDFILFTSGSRLLSESPLLPSTSGLSSESYTGPGGDDLSISELSLGDRTVTSVQGVEPGNETRPSNPEEAERIKKHSGKLRAEKLQNDAFNLKKLNAHLKSFNDALGDVGSQNETLAAQLEQTESLLNRYVSILSGSEEFARLVFDDQWQGAEADELIVAREQREAEERIRNIKAEREAAARREQERLEREERERADQKEREQTEKDRKEHAAARGGVRGVRGTRASMRATRGTRTASSSSRPSNTSAGSASSSSAAPRGSSTTRGLSRRT
ncbi:hypothetical protein DFH07DRAFT_806088 [Mycena maculata]|uniref:DASH complex subunit DUO1 n=1 Tax=Mycena maculata TaxID=230809 RepID=A0AAD7JVB1_9AGAR|nr:hypothetical protein DFH07DRAFT_806088 [Mycena maculata]